MPSPLLWGEEELEEIKQKIRQTPAAIDLTEQTMMACRQVAVPERGFARRRRGFAAAICGAAAVLVFSVSVGASFVSPAMAASMKQIPGMGTLFQFASDLGLRTADERGMLTLGSSQSTHDGVTLTAPAAAFDGTRVVVGLERQVAEGVAASGSLQEQISNLTLLIDGQDIQQYTAGSQSHSIGSFGFSGPDSNSYLMEVSDLKNQGGRAFPDQFELTARVALAGIAEPFELQIPVRRAAGENRVLEPKAEKSYNGLTFKVNKLELTPITTNVTTETQFTSAAKAAEALPRLNYDVTDEQGRNLQSLTGHGWTEEDGSTSIMDMRFEPFSSVPKTIHIRPYWNEYQKGGDGLYALDEQGNPKKIYIPELEIEIQVGEGAVKAAE
ncbi:hypothetical protein B9G55_12865 [Saccharibacillus sp. O16]|nr:hypothetical protein B9G55_12865 [Saccharibacillus sp. O16]